MPGLAEDTRIETQLKHLIDPSQSQLFTENCNKKPFLFHHNLCEVEQFQPRYLRQVAQRLVDADTPIYVNSGKGKVDASFDAADEGGKQFSAAEALDQMQDEELLFKLPRISRMPEYQQFLGECFSEILAMSSLPPTGWDAWRSISVFMAGPRRITPYHIDAEMGYLCQVSGTKKVWIADGSDRDILSNEELEQFWRGQGQAAKFKDIAKERAYEFTLTPGTGVHIPINFPHWVENGDNVSISVSLGFHAVKYRPGAVHRFNSYLRQMHLNPTPPGKRAWLDAAKEQIYESGKAAAGMMKRTPAKA
jgi:hypothetical protein